MKSVFDYMNFRDYLRDYYTEKKAQQSYFSYRLFSEKAGFKSPNFLKLVIDGQRNLTKDSVFKFCKAMRLNKKECDYFENLVFFNQSKTLDEKNAYLANVMKHRNRGDPRRIEQTELSYYSEWYHPVIRELVVAVDFGGDYGKLARALIPSITAQEAERSIKLLSELGFIEPDNKGGFRKASASLTTGSVVKSIGVANYHRLMMTLGEQAIGRFGVSDRDIECLTVGVSEQTYRNMMTRAHEFLMEMLKMAGEDAKNERIVQMNVQVFPLSKLLKCKNGGDRG
jgi:uncharacterized protein (TIGR02147 family)